MHARDMSRRYFLLLYYLLYYVLTPYYAYPRNDQPSLRLRL